MISVIVPNFNQGNFISKAIISVLTQTYKDFELIIVDDGSTDDSKEEVLKFNNSVRYIYQENKGLAGARNTGIRAARGEYIGLLDADDEWQPMYLEKMMQLVEQHPGAAVYYCRAQAIDEEGNPLPQVFGGPILPPDKLYQRILRANFIIPSTVVMQKRIVISQGLFDETEMKIHGVEDWDLWLRLLPKNRFVGTNNILVKYRIHGNSLSTNSTRMQEASYRVVSKKFGPEDGNVEEWSVDKRRAYGGVYRFNSITSIQRKADWESGFAYLIKAISIDPSLTDDLDFFYDLALGTQAAGYRGTQATLQLKENYELFFSKFKEFFRQDKYRSSVEKLARKIKGIAHYAFGLVGYNTGQYSLTRPNLVKAFFLRPSLLMEPLFRRTLIVSLIGVGFVKEVKKLKNSFSR